MSSRGDSKRPLAAFAGAEHIKGGTRNCNDNRIEKFTARVGPRDKNEEESSQREEWRQGIKPYSERTRKAGLALAEEDDPNLLQQVLQHDAYHDQCGNGLCQREKAERRRNQAEREQREIRKMATRMQMGEDAKVVPIERGGIRDARVSEEQRKHRRERGPHDQYGHHLGSRRAEGTCNHIGNRGALHMRRRNHP